MNVLVWLAIILFVLMKVIGGEKGTRSFIALFSNFGVILVTILLLTDPTLNPIVITLIACMVISYVNLFYINTFNFKSITAFISTVMTLIILILLIFVMVKIAKIQGFGVEEVEELQSFSFHVGLNFKEIAMCTIIMGTIGAITDTAISISSAMNEIYQHNPSLDRYNLFQSGMNVGKDILGTTTNTLFFAFIGGYLALIFWFKDLAYSLGEVVNGKVFSQEVIAIFCTGTGAILVIPITAWLAASRLVKYQNRTHQKLL